MSTTTFSKSRRYVEARTEAPSPTEALVLTIFPDKSEGTSRRFRLLLEGAYAITCLEGHVHPVAVHEQSSQWVEDEPDDDLHLDVLAAYEQEADAAERIISAMLTWALDGWTAPCQT